MDFCIYYHMIMELSTGLHLLKVSNFCSLNIQYISIYRLDYSFNFSFCAFNLVHKKRFCKNDISNLKSHKEAERKVRSIILAYLYLKKREQQVKVLL
jgi:hypothetical protein